MLFLTCSHSGPVWQVAWAHPKYGHILASCSYDGKVLIWKEQGPATNAPQSGSGNWTKIKEYTAHSASGELGGDLQRRWSDPFDISKRRVLGTPRTGCHRCLRLFRRKDFRPHLPKYAPNVFCSRPESNNSFVDDGQWNVDLFDGHVGGCTAVSWAPATLPGSLINPSATPTPNPATNAPPPPPVKRFVSAGCDNKVKIWVYRTQTSTWAVEDTLEGHSDWVRDVSWAPNIGLPRSYVATASQDKTVCIWTKDSPNAPWVKTVLEGGAAGGKFPDVVWRVSWSLAGNILAVSCGDGKVTLWKENLKGAWECVSEMTS